jgi:AcrR family transcriptional regulator
MVEAKKRRKPAEVRCREILRAAGKVLGSRGYHNVHLDDVAAAAGLSKGTLYLYFKDKESLFAEVLEDVIDRLEESLKAISMEGPALGSLERIAAVMLDFVDEHQDFLVQFSREKPDLCGKRAGNVLQRRYAGHLRFVAEAIARGVKEGVVREHDSMMGSLYFTALVRMFMLQKVMEGGKNPLRPKAGELMALFLNGLGGGRAPHA